MNEDVKMQKKNKDTARYCLITDTNSFSVSVGTFRDLYLINGVWNGPLCVYFYYLYDPCF